MDTTQTLLDQLKLKLSLRSDYALAKYLGVTTVTLGRWRTGGSFSDENAIRVADLLNLPRPYVVACMHAQSADEDTESSGVWRQIADTFKEKAAVSALLAALCFSGFAANDVHAAGAFELPNNVYYGKFRMPRDRRHKKQPLIKAAA